MIIIMNTNASKSLYCPRACVCVRVNTCMLIKNIIPWAFCDVVKKNLLLRLFLSLLSRRMPLVIVGELR